MGQIKSVRWPVAQRLWCCSEVWCWLSGAVVTDGFLQWMAVPIMNGYTPYFMALLACVS